RVPAPEEVARVEADVAAHPDDYRLARKLGKAYFFQYFGEGRTSAIPKAQKTLERVLELQKDDAETIAYLGALAALQSLRSKDAAVRKAKGEQGLELLKKALQLGTGNGAVAALARGSFMFLPDAFGSEPIATQL